MSLHQRQVHPEFVEGCFGCKVGTLQLTPGDATTRLNMSPRKWDKELKAYNAIDTGLFLCKWWQIHVISTAMPTSVTFHSHQNIITTELFPAVWQHGKHAAAIRAA